MNPELWARAEAIFGRALDLPAAERADLVAAECGSQAELRAYLLDLLDRDATASRRQWVPGWSGLLRQAVHDPERPPSNPGPLLESGIRVGDAEVVRLLGHGAFGRVYLGIDRLIGRNVALKVVDVPPDADDGWREQLLREARLIGNLSSPHVVTLFRVHPPGDVAAWTFEMEYVAGGTLQHRLATGHPLELDQLRKIAGGIAAGLAEAHAAGVVHGDIKPGNILLTPSGDARIADFGLARVMERENGPFARSLRGTPLYMAPEVALGHRATSAADIWSFGVVLYEMLTGRTPFRAQRVARLFHEILHQPYPPLPSSTPPELRTVVGDCLERSSRRIGDGQMLTTRLRKPQPGTPPRTRADPPGRRSEARLLRNTLEALQRGTGATVAFTGESGIGKTHLGAYARDLARQRGIVWLETHASRHDGVLRPLLKAVRDLATAEIRTPDSDVFRTALQSANALLDERDSRTVDVARVTMGYLAELISGVVSENRLTIFIDELRHVDREDRELIEHLLDMLEPNAIVWLLADADRDFWHACPAVQHVALPLMTGEAIYHVLQQAAGIVEIEPCVVNIVIRFAGGNPQSAVQYLRYLEDSGTATRVDGVIRSGPGWGRTTLPETLSAVVEDRLSRLSVEERDLLEAAAIEGYHFTGRNVAALLDQRPVHVLRALQRLIRGSRLVVATARDYRFLSEAYRNSIYEALAPNLRRALHERLAQHLSAHEDADPESLGEHWLCAGRLDIGRAYLLEAALRAQKRQEVSRGLELCRKAGLTPDDIHSDFLVEHPEAVIAMGVCLADRGDSQASARVFGELERHRGARRNDTLRLRAMACRTKVLLPKFGNQVVDEDQLVEATRVLPPSSAELGHCHYTLGWSAIRSGELDKAVRHLEQASAIYTDAESWGNLSSALDQLGGVAGMRADYRTAAKLRRKAAEESIKAGRRPNAAISRVNEIIARFDGGELDGIETELEEQARILQVEDTPDFAQQTHLVRAHVLYSQGRIDDAFALASRVRDHFVEAGHTSGAATAHLLLGELDALRGNLDAAAAACAAARQRSESATETRRLGIESLTTQIAIWTGEQAEARRIAARALEAVAASQAAKLRHSFARALAILAVYGLEVRAGPLVDDADPGTRGLVRAAAALCDGDAPAMLASAGAYLAAPPADRHAVFAAHVGMIQVRGYAVAGQRQAAYAAARRVRTAAVRLKHRWLRETAERFLAEG